MKRALPFILLASLSAEAPAQTQTGCSVQAVLIDMDMEGTNVRSGAGTTFPVIGRLPAERTDIVRIVAAKGAWVKIVEALNEEGETIFARQGWVHAPLLGMTTSWNPAKKAGQHNLYSGPSAKSRVIGSLPAETPVSLESCRGKWVKVKHEGRTGWLAPEAQCANSRTNCS